MEKIKKEHKSLMDKTINSYCKKYNLKNSKYEFIFNKKGLCIFENTLNNSKNNLFNFLQGYDIAKQDQKENNIILLKYIENEIKESEENLKNLKSSYEDVLKNKYRNLEDEEDINSANFEAGKLAVLYKLKKMLKGENK